MKNKRISSILMALVLSMAMVASCAVGALAKTEAEYNKDADAAANKAATAGNKAYQAEQKAFGIQKEIESKTAEIAKTKAQLEKKQNEVKTQESALNDRLTAMYKTGTVGYIDVILSSEGITDLIQNLGTVQQILKSDQELLEELQDDYKEIEALKKTQEEAKKTLESKKAELDKLKEEYKAEAQKYKEDEDELRALANKAAQEAAAEAEKWEGNGSTGGGGGGGSYQPTPSGAYAWPTRPNWYFTSLYGWRVHPIWGDYRYHSGYDIVLTSGTYRSPAYAAGSGVVTKASYYGGYGNCVIISIGNGYSVLYGHLDQINVSYGQTVSKGQVVGLIGSTGNSTGPHLHYEVSRYGQLVDPMTLY